MSRIDEEKKQLTKDLIRRDLLVDSRKEFHASAFLAGLWAVIFIPLSILFVSTFQHNARLTNIFFCIFFISAYGLLVYFLWSVWKTFREIRRITGMDGSMISVTVDTVAGKEIQEKLRHYGKRVRYEEHRYIFFTLHKSIRTFNTTWYELLDKGDTCYVVSLLPHEETTLLFYPTDFYHFRDDAYRY